MMNNEELKQPENFEKDTEKNRESLLLEKIRELEEENKELKGKNRKFEENVAEFWVKDEKSNHDLIHDHVTGLNNKRYFEEKMEEVISSLKNPEREKLKEQQERKEGFINFSLLFCDLDKFKEVNDTYGHDAGDDVLKKVSGIIKRNVRPNDMVCRLSGDEFAVGLLGANEEDAAKTADKIRTAIEEGLENMGVTVSIGTGSYEEGLDRKSITGRADKAMYLAKKERNNVKKYSDFLEAEKAKRQEEEKK